MSERGKTTGEQERPGYWEESRKLSLSILFILPLIVAYHVGIVQSGSLVRNTAEVWLTGPLSVLGLRATQVLNIMLIAAFIVALGKLEQRGGICFSFLLLMLAESVLYAVVMLNGVGIVTGLLQERVQHYLSLGGISDWRPLLLAVGAGVYEELFFRLLLVGGVAFVLSKVFLWNRFWSLLTALIISSLVFSAAHYAGPLGETPHFYTFLFRAIAGLVLGLVYVARGLGVAVWTHALYNVLLLLT